MNSSPLQITHDPSWITEETLFAIHAQQIERYGGLHGVLAPTVVHSALVRPINKWAYGDDCDLADLAAMYLVAFAGSQGFNDGNKRTGLACALVFLAINGISVNDLEPASLQKLTLDVANNRASPDDVALYFRCQLTGDQRS